MLMFAPVIIESDLFIGLSDLRSEMLDEKDFRFKSEFWFGLGLEARCWFFNDLFWVEFVVG